MRKIVLMQSHEWLLAASSQANFSIAAAELETRKPPGVEYVVTPPVPVEGRFVLAADIEEGAEADLLAQPDVDGVFVDPEIAAISGVCPPNDVGDIEDVRKQLSLTRLVDAGNLGRGVRVAVVDTGVDGTQVNVSGGFSPWPGIAPGGAVGGHGTMCAVDVGIAAPEAQIHDYPLLRSGNGTWVAFLSDAIRFFAEIMTTILQVPGPMVVTNSWALFNRAEDAPLGHPQNYSANPAHPFNTITTALVRSGADVLFAAGNCGEDCPDGRCGTGDIGPGDSVHGANSHPDVISVAAVTVDRDRLGYSSQGPGALTAEKPDVSCYSHFVAPGFDPSSHRGTSAACPVAAGVVAALRSKPSAREVAPDVIKAALLQSAKQPAGVGAGWNGDFGHGIVDASAAWDLL